MQLNFCINRDNREVQRVGAGAVGLVGVLKHVSARLGIGTVVPFVAVANGGHYGIVGALVDGEVENDDAVAVFDRMCVVAAGGELFSVPIETAACNGSGVNKDRRFLSHCP